MSIKKIFSIHFLEFSLFSILILIRLISLQFPLIKNLDLEISIIYALIFSFISGFGSIYHITKNGDLLRFIKRLLIIQFLLFVIFVFIELLVCNFSLDSGIFFFPLFTITVTIFWSSAAVLIVNLFRRFRFLIMMLVYFSFALYSLVNYYFEPQLFLYNPLIIFFPGLVYNDFFELSFSILIYCGSLLIASSIIIFLHIHRSNDKIKLETKNYLKLSPILIYSCLFILSNQIGLSTNQLKLKNHFPIQISDKKIKIYFEAKNIEKLHQLIYLEKTKFHVNQLKKELNYDIPFVEIFIFESDESKKRLLGDEKADFTKPWLNQIYVTRNSFDQTIKHELAHVFLGQRTSNIFKVAAGFNLALIEGGAMALEWEWIEDEPIYYAALINRFITSIDAEQLFKNYFFVTSLNSISYIYSGSFIRYVIDEYGIEKFLKFYQTGKFYEVYQRELNSEFERFRKKLGKIPLTSEDSLKTRVLFGGQSMFQFNCPRSIARKARKAQSLLNNREFIDAEKMFSKLYDKTNDIKYFVSLVRSKFYQKKFDEVIKVVENSIWKNEITTINSVYLKILYALSLAKVGEHENAKKDLELLKKLKISSNWSDYIDLIEFISNKSEFISMMTDLSFNQFIRVLMKNFPDENIILKNSINHLDSNQLEKVIKNNSNDFWTLEFCFFRYIQLANFVKAQDLIHLIKTNFSELNQVQNYHLNMMDYVLRNLMDRNL